MMVFPCHVCRTSLSAEDSQAGQLVRCPQCLTTLRVPAPAPTAKREPATVGAGASVGGGSPSTASERYTPPRPGLGQQSSTFRPGGGKRYGFNCGYCSSRLEATESMGAQDGQCPTCQTQIPGIWGQPRDHGDGHVRPLL